MRPRVRFWLRRRPSGLLEREFGCAIGFGPKACGNELPIRDMEADVMTSKSKRLSLSTVAVLALACFSAGAAAQQPIVPVLAGGEAEYDACGSQGAVRGLDAAGDGFLAVRGGPSSKHDMLDKIYNGQVVNLCDERGNWLGVVYSQKAVDCGVGTPWPSRQVYSGPCSSGWVYRKYVIGFAG